MENFLTDNKARSLLVGLCNRFEWIYAILWKYSNIYSEFPQKSLFTFLFSNVLLKVKNIYIHNEMFSIENGLLTPTLKAKRPELKEFFKKKIDDLYSSISMWRPPWPRFPLSILTQRSVLTCSGTILHLMSRNMLWESKPKLSCWLFRIT